jgi:hypothetical protein
MNSSSFFLSLVVVPAVVLAATSCSSMSQTRMRLAEWKEKRAEERDERRMAKELASAEKEIAEEAAMTGQVAATEDKEGSIFLDYENPSGSLLSGGDGAVDGASAGGGGPALPGSDLPTVMDFAGTEEDWASADQPVFHGDAAPSTGAPVPMDADLVRAWASTISPLTGASLAEPLITAAMTAQVTPTESAVAAHAAATDSAPLASAFAGQPSRSILRTSLTSELEHE